MVKIKDNKKGWDDLKRRLKNVQGAQTKVGVFGNTDTTEEGTDMILIAATHEFGAPDSNIPERSFIRSTFDENKEEMTEFIAKTKGLVLDGKLSVKAGLSLIGEKFQALVQATISDPNGPGPELSQRTKDKKGSSNPLIYEGRLRESIRHVEEV